METEKEIIATVFGAIVREDASGIDLVLQNKEGKKTTCFVPRNAWGTIPPDKNPKQELQIIADIFMGTKRSANGKTEPVENFIPKKIILKSE
jgi:hypothetical protein